MTTSIQNSHQVPQLRVDDHYQIERVLDLEGLGQAFLSMDTQLEQRVVLKVLKDPLATDTDAGPRFKQLVKLRAALRGDHIAQVLDSGTTVEGYPFYVMEHLPGESLKQCLQRDRKFSIRRAVCIASQICVALAESYQSRFECLFESEAPFLVVPHELKPTQILLMTGEQVKLLDCGLTKTIRNSCCDTQAINSETSASQTFHYVAPEQLGGEENNHLADIYVLGILLYEMVSGTDPFGLGLNSRHVREGAWMYAHALREPRSLQLLLEKNAESVAVSDIVHRCLAKKPCDRYPSVDAVWQALEQLQLSDDLALEAVSDQRITPPRRPSSTVVDQERECSQDVPETQASGAIVDLDDCQGKTGHQEHVETRLQEMSVQDCSTKRTDELRCSFTPEKTEDTNHLSFLSRSEEIGGHCNLIRFHPLHFAAFSADLKTRDDRLDRALVIRRSVVDSEEETRHLELDTTVMQAPEASQPVDQVLPPSRLPVADSERDTTLSNSETVPQEQGMPETRLQFSDAAVVGPIDRTASALNSECNCSENHSWSHDIIEVGNAPDIEVDETIVQYSDAAVQKPVVQPEDCLQEQRGAAKISSPIAPLSSDQTMVQHEVENAPDIGVDETIVQYSDVAVQKPVVQPEDCLQEQRGAAKLSSPIAPLSSDQTMVQPIGEAPVLLHRPADGLARRGAADETIVQYLDSAVHNPAEKTVAQSIMLIDEQPVDQTVCQQNGPYVASTEMVSTDGKNRGQSQTIVRTVWRSRRSVTAVFRNFGGRCFSSLRRLLSFRPGRSLPKLPASAMSPPSFGQGRQSKCNIQSNSESDKYSHQELDRCRLDLAKELARNGKFRDAIATLKKIQELSPSYPKAQKLLCNWQGL